MMTALTVTELVIEYERADGSKVLAVDDVEPWTSTRASS